MKPQTLATSVLQEEAEDSADFENISKLHSLRLVIHFLSSAATDLVTFFGVKIITKSRRIDDLGRCSDNFN